MTITSSRSRISPAEIAVSPKFDGEFEERIPRRTSAFVTSWLRQSADNHHMDVNCQALPKGRVVAVMAALSLCLSAPGVPAAPTQAMGQDGGAFRQGALAEFCGSGRCWPGLVMRPGHCCGYFVVVTVIKEACERHLFPEVLVSRTVLQGCRG